MMSGAAAHADADRDTDAETIYLDIRLRILQAQFLPGQLIDRANIVSHFHATRAAADQAIDLLAYEGYLYRSLRGGYSIRRFLPEEVRATLALSRRIALVGSQALIDEPDDDAMERLDKLGVWNSNLSERDPAWIEDFTQRTRAILKLILRGPASDGVLMPLRLLSSPALHRLAVRSMTKADVSWGWQMASGLCGAIRNGDGEAASSILLNKPVYEDGARQTVELVNDLPAGPVASFYSPLPEFHSVIGDDPSYPYIGLGRQEG